MYQVQRGSHLLSQVGRQPGSEFSKNLYLAGSRRFIVLAPYLRIPFTQMSVHSRLRQSDRVGIRRQMLWLSVKYAEMTTTKHSRFLVLAVDTCSTGLSARFMPSLRSVRIVGARSLDTGLRRMVRCIVGPTARASPEEPNSVIAPDWILLRPEACTSES